MQDTEFFRAALGLEEPWYVKEVSMDVANKRVEVKVAVKERTKWAQDGVALKIRGYEERTWRHLDTMQFETLIRARVPRVEREDGSTEVVSVPWADRYSRLSRAMETIVIEVLKSTANVQEAARLLGMSWGTVDGVMKRAVERGLSRRQSETIRYLGMDEKSIGSGHHYASLLTDLEGKRVWDVVEHRDGAAAGALLESLSSGQRGQVEAVAMDMWPAYLKAAKEKLPHARVVHDKFHVSKYLNEALDAVRKLEHRGLLAQGDRSLSGTKYAWLRHHHDKRSSGARAFRELYAANLKTSRAWRIKESFGGFWHYRYPGAALKYFKAWKKSALLSRLKPVRKVALMLDTHLDGLLNYCLHPITNASSEAFNSKAAALIANARGLGSFQSFRTRVLFYCGKLQLMPSNPVA